jgi:hypothetical protein
MINRPALAVFPGITWPKRIQNLLSQVSLGLFCSKFMSVSIADFSMFAQHDPYDVRNML